MNFIRPLIVSYIQIGKTTLKPFYENWLNLLVEIRS
jgi:hypothetical protein